MAAALLLAGTAVVLAQGIAGPLGVPDATARKLVVDAILQDGFRIYESQGVRSDFVVTIKRAYDKIPTAARGPATTAAFAWAKTYVSSPAFAAAYAKTRDEQKPAGAPNAPSIDEVLKKRMDEQVTALAESRAMVDKLPEAARAAALANLKAMETQLKAPETLGMWRKMFELELGEKASSAGSASAAWEARFPANPNAFVRDHLQRFLTGTANVDYSLAAVVVKGPGGEVQGFLSPGYTGMPWQHIHAIVAGKEAVDAGRAAAGAWLKDLEGK